MIKPCTVEAVIESFRLITGNTPVQQPWPQGWDRTAESQKPQDDLCDLASPLLMWLDDNTPRLEDKKD